MRHCDHGTEPWPRHRRCAHNVTTRSRCDVVTSFLGKLFNRCAAVMREHHVHTLDQQLMWLAVKVVRYVPNFPQNPRMEVERRMCSSLLARGSGFAGNGWV